MQKEAFNQLTSEDGFAFGFMLGMAGKNAKETCVNVIMSALAIVNAASGDVGLVRAFRKVRNSDTSFMASPKESHLYSTHVIANMCLGLLFLGHGRYGLSMSNMSLASLLIAFYPVYGHAIYDNRCYFQAFRFLWTLAIEPRFLVAVADGSHVPVEAQLDVEFKVGSLSGARFGFLEEMYGWKRGLASFLWSCSRFLKRVMCWK